MNFEEEKKNVLLFFILTFVISWILWLPSVLVSSGLIPAGPIQILGQFAIFGPFIAAFALTFANTGKDGAKQLFFVVGTSNLIKNGYLLYFYLFLFQLLHF